MSTYRGVNGLCRLCMVVLLCVLVLKPTFCIPQDAAPQALQSLMESRKIASPESTLSGFAEGKETVPVIVLLRESSAQKQRNIRPQAQDDSAASAAAGAESGLDTSAGRQLRRNRVKEVQDQFQGRIDTQKLRITRRFSYLAGFTANVTLAGMQELVKSDEVVSIEEDRVLHAHLAQGIPLMNASTARSQYDGSGLSIAICDTGIDTSHPMLGGGGFPNAKVIGGCDVGDNDSDPRPNATLGQAHGTACAGIAAGSPGTVGDYIGGVAPGAKLYAVKISYGNTGSAYTSDMIEGWEWCITHQYDNAGYPIMIISTSFGGNKAYSTCDSSVPAMTQAAANAAAAGITIFCSSGNNGYCDSMGWPACISHVISVGAVYDAAFGTYYPCVSADSCATKYSTSSCSTGWYAVDTTAADMVTSYSNAAGFLSLLAPANAAYTADIVGSGGYTSGDYTASFGGTSAACPYAAGAAAVLQSAASSKLGRFLSPAEVKDALVTTGDSITDGKVAITKPRVNLAQALDTLKSGSDGGVLWDQPLSTVSTRAHTSQDFETAYNKYDTFIADDFTNTRTWSIRTISIPGNTWNEGCDLTCASMLRFFIYRDKGGVPDGYPDGGLGAGGNSPLWSLSVAPTDSRVTLSTGTGGYLSTVTVRLSSAVQLNPGTYWLVFYPTMALGGCCQYGRQPADTTNGNPAVVIDPGGGFTFPTTWTAVTSSSTFAISQQDFSFRLEGGILGGNTPATYLLILD